MEDPAGLIDSTAIPAKTGTHYHDSRLHKHQSGWVTMYLSVPTLTRQP